MFGLEKLFNPATNFKNPVQQGALVIDVRTAAEFSSTHVTGAFNISLEQVNSRVKELLQLNQPVITCCRSGARRAVAVRMLQLAGIVAYNAGSCNSLQKQ